MSNDAIRSSATPKVPARLRPAKTITSADDLLAIQSPAFFFSPTRAELRIPDLSQTEQQRIEHRLNRLQSVCGCGPAAAALVAGIIYGVLGHTRAWPIILSSVCLAAVAKFATIAVAYATYRVQIRSFRNALLQTAR